MELIVSQVTEKNLDFSYLDHLYDKCNSAVGHLNHVSRSPLVMASLNSLIDTLTFHQLLLKTYKEEQCKPPINKYGQDQLLQNNNTKRKALVDEMVVSPTRCSKGFNDIVGLDEPKMLLKEACLMPIQFPHLFSGTLKTWSRILLYGPPGTGKTLLAKALCEEMNGDFLSISSADLLSAWVGESEKHVRDLFREARERPGKTIIFIDEIDSLCRQRTQTEDEHTRRVKTELLCQLDGVLDDNQNCLVLAATNCPWDLDRAFMRRFERRILIDVPDRECRRGILNKLFDEEQLDVSPTEWETILDLTEGFSGADLTHLSMATAFVPIRELHSGRFWRFTIENRIVPCSSDHLGAMQYTLDKLPPDRVIPRIVGFQDFLTALKSTPKTVTSEILEKYREFAAM